MMRVFYHTGAKVAACFLAILCGMLTLISGTMAFYAYEYHFFGENPTPFSETQACFSVTSAYANDLDNYILYADDGWGYADTFSPKKTNFRYRIMDENGEVLMQNLVEGEEITFVSDWHFGADSDTLRNPITRTESPVKRDSLMQMECYILDKPEILDEYAPSYQLHMDILQRAQQGGLLPFFGINFVACAAVLIYLVCAAGHRPDSEEIMPNVQDKIPYDLYLGATCVAMTFCVLAIGLCIASGGIRLREGYLPILLAAMCAALIVLLANLLTFATRAKLGRYFWQNTICYRLWGFFLRLCHTGFAFCGDILRGIPLIWQVVVVWLAIGIFYVMGGFPAIFLHAVLLCVLCWIAIQLDTLRKGGEALATGDMAYRVDTKRMLPPLREHGENLNSISEGLSLAVEQQMKSERMKTDLITNVSHDIKTPLTSIINYVDLLKKEELEGKPAEYIDVLDRQSQRLKKLTEDLVEASKASTGNLKHELVATDLCELATQAIAEYEGKLAAAQLDMILSGTDAPIYAMADGALTWRIMNNLLGNICKYAQPGTRVYCDIQKKEDSVLVSLKNISRDALNIPADELMERFVRGDSARHTEGSGLGLNIAQSLASLQGGDLRLTIDGDLFKVELMLPGAKG